MANAVSGSDRISISVAGYQLSVGLALPGILDHLRSHALLTEHFDLDRHDRESGTCFVAVQREPADWPQLVVTQRFAPAGYGFDPGVLVVPKTGVVFIGAGERLIAYSTSGDDWKRLWLDAADMGFWCWRQHGDVVVMSAELELAAWTAVGEKLWSTFVEPPWSYTVEDGRIELDVMGKIRTFPIAAGPDSR
jgi:hypothetical protein